MSKKRFSQGLDDLFSEPQSGQPEGGIFVAKLPIVQERKAAHKNFASGLDALLQEALEESLERYEANQPDSVTASSKSKATDLSTAPLRSGLDALIRQTIDVQEIMSDEASGKKRLTVVVDRPKLDKLKTIARLENAYLKDLLVTLIDGYIQEYTQKRGVDL
jgi:hypothetical protein